MPAWFGRQAPVEDLKELVAVQNGLLYLPTRQLLAHSPEFFSPNVLGFAYDPKARCPRWMQFLEEVWPGDAAAQLALGELFGLLVTDVTRCHKAFMLVGPKRGGRGTICRVIHGLIGKENFVGASFNNFKGDFGLQGWIGKKVAVFADAKLEGATKAQQSGIAERIQSISGEDKISIPRKYLEDFKGQLGARIVIFANALLQFLDDSGALAERFVLWEMKQSFAGREDRYLTDKLLAELPGILNWALDGLDRLRAKGWQFEQHGSGEEMADALRDLASNIRAFTRDRCTFAVGAQVTLDDVYQAWVGWCRGQNLWHGTKEKFSSDFRAAFPALHIGRNRSVAGVRNTAGRPGVVNGMCLRGKG
jgi:putative DNA primase/helicase